MVHNWLSKCRCEFSLWQWGEFPTFPRLTMTRKSRTCQVGISTRKFLSFPVLISASMARVAAELAVHDLTFKPSSNLLIRDTYLSKPFGRTKRYQIRILVHCLGKNIIRFLDRIFSIHFERLLVLTLTTWFKGLMMMMMMMKPIARVQKWPGWQKTTLCWWKCLCSDNYMQMNKNNVTRFRCRWYACHCPSKS